MGMPPQTFDVRGNVPVAIAATPLGEALTVLNMDTVNEIYLSAEPVSGGFPLSPGSTMTWDAGQRLYITCVDGANARVGVVYNGGQIIDSRALAVQIVNAGLADDIATKISLAGVPTIDRPKTVVEISGGGPIDPAVTLTPTPVDVSGYLSLSGTLYVAVSAVTTMELIVEQSDSVTAYRETRYTFSDGTVDFDIPLTHNFVSLTLQKVGGGSAVNYNAYFRASYRNRDEKVVSDPSSWQFISDGPPRRIGTSATISLPPTGRLVTYPSWRTGDVTLTFGFNSEAMAALNTKGVGALYGEGPTPAYGSLLSRGHIGEAKWMGTDLKPRIYTGYCGRDIPRLNLYNWNTVDITLNITLQYRV